MPNKIDFRLKKDISGPDSAFMKKLEAVPQLKKWAVNEAVVEAGAGPIVRRARQLAPRDTKGHGKKRSKKQERRAKWHIPLWSTIKYVVRKYGSRHFAVSVVGPEWPEGNKAYFDTSPSGRRVFYWGKDAGKTKAQIRNWIVQAAEETRRQQLQAMEVSLKRSLDNIFKRG